MKKIALASLTLAAGLLAGCVVTSVYPFYNTKDLVFQPALAGKWINAKNAGEVWNFEKKSDLVYRFTIAEAQKTTEMEARAFKLRGQLFLDIFSLENDYHVIPAHYLLRVSRLSPDLVMSELNETWLSGLLAKEPSAIRHHFVQFGDKPEEQRIVLTANTAELRRFVIAHLDTPQAWKQSFELRREVSITTSFYERISRTSN